MLGLDVNVTNKNTDIIELAIGYKWTKNGIDYDRDIQQNQEYNEQIFYTDFALNLGENWTISSTIDYTRYSNASFGAATDIALWRAALEYRFLENKRGTLKLAANDMLNQNLGINRHSQLNFVQEQRITSLARYFMLSFMYKLSAFGNEDGIEVVRRR